MDPNPIGVCSAADCLRDAAETLAGGAGAASLALEAVAQLAGVSKDGLLALNPGPAS